MNAAFYTGVSGMIANQKGLDHTAHNLANINTVGYKTSKSDFEELLYSRMDVNVETTSKTGHGVRSDIIKTDFSQAMMITTGNDLDFAIAGDGFFAVDAGGTTLYTRNGEFKLSMAGETAYLVDSRGNYVLSDTGQRIQLTTDPDTGLKDYSKLRESIGVYSFENTQGLAISKDGYFAETQFTGTRRASNGASTGGPVKVLGGALEASGTNLGTEMAAIIQSQRAYQVSARVVRSADEIEEIVNNLR